MPKLSGGVVEYKFAGDEDLMYTGGPDALPGWHVVVSKDPGSPTPRVTVSLHDDGMPVARELARKLTMWILARKIHQLPEPPG